MDHATIASVFEATVLLSTVCGVAVGARHAFAPRVSPCPLPVARPMSAVARLALHPLAQFLFVCALLYLNQVLFGAFILRAHHGSTAFISRFIPGGWFAIGTHDPLVAFASHHVGDGRWLSPTLLRVQAFLELPFTIFAYLAVARLLGRRLYTTLCSGPILALVSLSFSVTFSLVELSLPNPYTQDDLVLRAIACLVIPVYVAWIARVERRGSPDALGPSGVPGLLVFLAGAGAISYIVLALYDAFLLYNLAHFPRYAPGLAIALVIAVAASFGAPRFAKAPSPGMDLCVSALRAFTILFAVPSLSLRYWGAHPTAAVCGLVVVGLGLVAGAAGALRRARLGPDELVRLACAGGVAIAAGGWAARFALVTGAHGDMPELLLARLALSFLVVAIVTFRGVEIAVCWAKHETKAQADQA